MDEEYQHRWHIPAFGSWDCYGDLPFTQCFDSARQAGLLRYAVDHHHHHPHPADLYVAAGDLYQSDAVTPTMIVLPRRRTRADKVGDRNDDRRSTKEEKQKSWGTTDFNLKEPSTFVPSRPTPKPVDEDLYKIPPELLHAHPKKKGMWSFFSCCLVPAYCASS